VRRLSLSRRAKGILAGVAFLFSVGAVSTKLLSGRTNDFCFCVPPVTQPQFTMPEETAASAAIHGGALPARVVAVGAPVEISVFNVPPAAALAALGGERMRDRELAHLAVLWGTSNHFGHGNSSSSSHFMSSGSGGGGGMMMGSGHAANSNRSNTPSAHNSNAPAAHNTSHPAPQAPSGGVILPPTGTSGSTFGSNTDPIPGFGNGVPGVTTTPTVTLGGTLGGTNPGRGVGSFSVTPEPGTMLLTLTGVLAAFGVSRRRKDQENS